MTYEPNYSITNKEISQSTTETIENYSEILEGFGLKYNRVGHYLLVGKISLTQGWILHISIVRWQISGFLKIVVPFLDSYKVPFKIVQDKETARSVLDGNLGHSQVGKVISIYPENPELTVLLAKQLIELTRPFKGPKILTDAHLGGNVYTRYGSFNPTLISNSEGKLENHIYDYTGQLIKDIYFIPFEMRRGIDWPFSEIAIVETPLHKKTLKNIYRPISTLKSDPRGDVIKALYLNKYFWISWCVIKQGKKNMWSDEADRDIPDRLLWQRQLHEKLSSVVRLPKILDLFVEDDNTYLVMEYIKGHSLNDRMLAINKNCNHWTQLPSKDQLKILHYIKNVIEIITRLHRNGYVHRDITPVNFLVDSKDRLCLIDNELTYSIYLQKPTPPFEAGTYGFMSPEQLQVKIPTLKEDIYGLGATILSILTGLSPIVFSHANMYENLYFFIQNKAITEVIVASLHLDPSARPTLEKVHAIIDNYFKGISKGTNKHFRVDEIKIDPSLLEDVIHGGIRGLVNSPTVISDNLWYSKSSKELVSGRQTTEYSKTGGLSEGVSGVLYFLSIARLAGFNIEPCLKSYYKGWRYLNKKYLELLPDIAPGLYGGAAGIALAIASGIKSNLLEENSENVSLIQKLLEITPTNSLDIATGIAGHGTATLQCITFLEEKKSDALLKKDINIIIEAQQKNGYWIEFQVGRHKRAPAIGFTQGNSGIIWLLLAYSIKYSDNDVKTIALNSLNLLLEQVNPLKKAIKIKGLRNITSDIGTWDSLPGLILSFIKGYEITQNSLYKHAAEDLLYCYPARIVNDNFTQHAGLSSIGELYLEADKVFKNSEWQHRADWIVQVLLHTSIHEQDCYYWLSNNILFPTADLLMGNSGIIHFLIRYLVPNKIGYPVLQ